MSDPPLGLGLGAPCIALARAQCCPAPGVSLALSCRYGLCGIHYIDAGYLGFKAYFVAPRKGTVWVRAGGERVQGPWVLGASCAP